ncbi:MAG TPA: methyltransferase domain-containing protein [Bdellovibrionales bacterium]|nr:methyltransferase domain-containing protein [Bdellovibrionales bacterium]
MTGASAQPPARFVQIDDEGYFKFGDTRVSDAEAGLELMRAMRLDDTGRLITELQGTQAFVEAFDEPLVVAQILATDGESLQLQMPYGHTDRALASKLTLDEWDRFHGTTEKGLSFVLSRKAQAELFSLADEFSDTSITLKGREIALPNWLPDSSNVENERFWSEIYETEPTPGWDLGGPSPALKDILPQLKLPKSRVLVLGAGQGHDAAFFASQGHLVTAVDMSPNAEAGFRKHYPHQENVTYIVSDLFTLPAKMHHSYDVVFEHTCFCAINPAKRNQMVKVWRNVLAEDGHLLGIFMIQNPRQGPPFGSSEWELHQRMKKGWDFLYWTRWKKSAPRRMGRELVVYAQKKPL